ncbi:FecR family protein [Mucilaginibacter sp. cycad4]|uniref:FecR family protein n=1 Tax=Mucilaginibacter sp. cycad4 TaxID=3342096 RepID=UPI002AAA6F65|nr:FecR family protein [Mucilaginibacter gossypii]WPV02127.1 FecR family protein [Mucilaginibacter gossypii]
MLNNNYDKVEDFLLDDSFVEWVLGESKTLDSYWRNFITDNPDKAGNLNHARDIVLSVKIRPVPDLSDPDIDQIISNVQHKRKFTIPEPEKPEIKNLWSIARNLMRYAAIIATIMVVSWLGYSHFKNTPEKLSQVGNSNTPLQRVINETSLNMLVKLPDHSSVILKPYAQLTYPVVFSDKSREVHLTGEAFFEVTKNPRRPFYVHSNELTVRVVGTSFTVKAYRGDKKFNVIVSTGKVLVTVNIPGSRINSHSILLTPNQQAVLYRKNMLLEEADIKKPLLLSKQSTQIHFNFVGTPFSKVISTIEEAYGVKINYNEKVMGNCPLTASLVDQPLDERLHLICKAVEAEYKIADGTITIEGKGCNN